MNFFKVLIVGIYLLDLAAPALARAEDTDAIERVTARYVNAIGDEGPRNVADLSNEERIALAREASRIERQIYELRELYRRDARARERAHDQGVAATLAVADEHQANATKAFADFIHADGRGGRVATERGFRGLANSAPILADFGPREKDHPAATDSNIDVRLQTLAREYVGHLIDAAAIKDGQSPTGVHQPSEVALRLLMEAYALAGNTLGRYEAVRWIGLERVSNAAMAVASAATVVTVYSAFNHMVDSYVPLTSMLVTFTSAAVIAAVTVREAAMIRFDRPLRHLRSRKTLRHRADHANRLIDRFWTYVGDSIETMARGTLMHDADPTLANRYRLTKQLLGDHVGPGASARVTARSRMNDFTDGASLAKVCERSLFRVPQTEP